MIDRRVVLVLGAGASKPYGFPLGGELIDFVRTQDMPNYIRSRLGGPSPNLTQIAEFRNDLLMSSRSSVDAFLETNPQYLGVGRETIALLISAYESDDSLYIHMKKEEDWYTYFIELLIAQNGLRALNDGSVSVITYNYDRSFEYFFYNAICKATPELSPVDRLAIYQTVPIVHIHGSLGLPSFVDPTNGQPYTPIKGVNQLEKAARSIRVIGEDLTNDPAYRKAHGLLAGAEVVLFLGFGFHELNMERLDLGGHCRASVEIGATVRGLTTAEKSFRFDPYTRHFAALTPIDGGSLYLLRNCLTFLRQPK